MGVGTTHPGVRWAIVVATIHRGRPRNVVASQVPPQWQLDQCKEWGSMNDFSV